MIRIAIMITENLRVNRLPLHCNYIYCKYDTTSMAVRLTRVSRVREVWSSNLGLAKSYAALKTVGSSPLQHLRK